MSYIQREIDKLKKELHATNNPELFEKIYAAIQALAWALEPNGYAGPYNMLMNVSGKSSVDLGPTITSHEMYLSSLSS